MTTSVARCILGNDFFTMDGCSVGNGEQLLRQIQIPWVPYYLPVIRKRVMWRPHKRRIVACPRRENSCISGDNVDKCLVNRGIVFHRRLKAVKMVALFNTPNHKWIL